MSLPPLTIIPAGAGSGKTHAIQTRLSEWVAEGLVRPERIVAVTFTEAAAAELRGRIRAQLLREGRTEDALRLERAYISTIHAFGLRLLSEFAFDAGDNPSPRKLDESEQALLIRRALARTDKADRILDRLWAFGYRYNGGTGETAEEQFRERILHLIGLLRSVDIRSDGAGLLPQVEQRIRAQYGETGDEEIMNTALLRAVEALLVAFPHNLAGQFKFKNANEGVDWNFQLCKALNGETARSDWKLWQDLRGLFVSQGKTTLPEGYDALAQAVMAAADALLRHPGPLNQALAHAEGLVRASLEALTAYADSKRSGGLLDYTDMLALAQGLLAQHESVPRSLAKRVDCLVIDEFQDTNPLQFALLWHLHSAGVPAVVVGDLKQAIMGFQHADPRLLTELLRQNPGAADPLRSNWRSSPALMGFLNALGAGLFGAEYTELEPRAPFESRVAPLEVIEFTQFSRANLPPAQHTAVRIREMLAEGHQVWDRRGSMHRPMRPGDIAILCPTHARAEVYATALRQAGLRPRLAAQGWRTSPAVRLACTALQWVADPADGHAALALAVTELGSHTLESALAALLDGADLDDPILQALIPVAQGVADRDVPALVRETLEALDLYAIVSAWPDAAQARANLLRLDAEAGAFAAANRDALEAGRFHGSGLKTFLAWLAGRAGQQDGDRQPDPRVLDEEAVEVVTWHAAKGREWPVVAVCGTDYVPPVRLPAVRAEYADFADLSAVLERASVAVYPDFAAPETQVAFRAPLAAEHLQERLRLLYVALTRARECLILEWQRHQDSKAYTADEAHKRSYHRLLTDATGVELDGNAVTLGDQRFECRVTHAGRESPAGIEDADETGPAEPLPTVGLRAIQPRPLPEGLTPEFVTPSALEGGSVSDMPPEVRTERYGEGLRLDISVAAMERGILLHRCFEVLSGHPERVDRLEAATGLALVPDQIQAVARSVSDFDAWLTATFVPSRVEREVPFLVIDDAGSVVSGVVDLLFETEAGFWILDHKSDATDDPASRFSFYWPQLCAYEDAVRRARTEKPVLGVGINWIGRGEVYWVTARSTLTRPGDVPGIIES
jgi:ATP-dependent exoDNAse (exonuclease V) beta subunit